jgi:hypothetical protein
MNWDTADFIFAGLLVAAIGIPFALAVRHTRSLAYLAGTGLALATGFVLVWANAAVGIIGSAANDANMMFFGVLAVGIGGALLARFRPGGLAKALAATAAAQLLAGAIALAFGLGGPGLPTDVLGATGVFTVLWLAAAGLFRMAGRGSAVAT